MRKEEIGPIFEPNDPSSADTFLREKLFTPRLAQLTQTQNQHKFIGFLDLTLAVAGANYVATLNPTSVEKIKKFLKDEPLSTTDFTCVLTNVFEGYSPEYALLLIHRDQNQKITGELVDIRADNSRKTRAKENETLAAAVKTGLDLSEAPDIHTQTFAGPPADYDACYNLRVFQMALQKAQVDNEITAAGDHFYHWPAVAVACAHESGQYDPHNITISKQRPFCINNTPPDPTKKESRQYTIHWENQAEGPINIYTQHAKKAAVITSHIEKTLGHYTSTVTLGNNTKDSEIAFALQLQAKVFFHFFKEENAKKCKPPTAYNPEDPEHGVQIKIDEQAFGGRAHQFKDLCFNAGFVKVFIGTQVHINPRFATAHPAEMRADVTNVSVPLAADENVSTTGFANPAFGLLNSSDSAWQQNPLYEGPGLGAGAENLYSEASMSRRPLPAATSQASNHAPGFFSGGWRNYFPGGKKPKLTSNPTYQPVPTNNSRPEFTGASQENPVYSPSHTYEEILEGPVKGQQLPAEPVYTRANGPEVFDDAASSLGGTTPPPPPEEIIPEDQDAHQATI